MVLQHLNWLAVAVSGLAYFMIGAVWFNQNVFGTAWMKGHNISGPTEEEKKKMPMMMLVTFLCCMVAAVCMGYFIHALGITNWMMGAKIGLIAGCGFAGVAIALNHMYTRKSLGLTIIDAGYHVAGLVVCGVILSAWH
ncbi:MAG: DUF1761 domain-containing protein [Bacteroidota bacterium]